MDTYSQILDRVKKIESSLVAEAAKVHPYAVGTRVFRSSGGENGVETHYGTVHRHTSNHYHVKWDSGEETKHRPDKSIVGDAPSNSHKYHSAAPTDKTEAEHHASRVADNEKMKARFEERQEGYKKEQGMRDRTRVLSNRLSNIKDLHPDHARAIHEILNKAGHGWGHWGEDEHKRAQENPHYGV